jgi:hypothetical protein
LNNNEPAQSGPRRQINVRNQSNNWGWGQNDVDFDEPTESALELARARRNNELARQLVENIDSEDNSFFAANIMGRPRRRRHEIND